MTKLAFKHPRRNGPKWRDYNPFILVGRGFLLLDDLVHHGLNKGAEKIEGASNRLFKGKCTLTKKRLAYGSLAAGTVSAMVIATIYPAPEGPGMSNPMGAILKWLSLKPAGIMFSSVVVLSSIKKVQQNVMTDVYDFLTFFDKIILKLYRFSGITHVLLGPLAYLKDADKCIFSFLTFGFGASITAYLMTSDNGMLGRFKKWLKESKDNVLDALAPKPAGEQAPVPIRED